MRVALGPYPPTAYSPELALRVVGMTRAEMEQLIRDVVHEVLAEPRPKKERRAKPKKRR